MTGGLKVFHLLSFLVIYFDGDADMSVKVIFRDAVCCSVVFFFLEGVRGFSIEY